MEISFWHNTIWYLALLATSIASLTAVLIKTKNRPKAIAFWLAVLGLTYWIEVSLILGFDAYAYYPGIAGDAFMDTVLGNMFSQISVSSTALLFCVFGLRKYWIFIFAGAYFLIDVLFAHLGIYVHNWYQSIYTFFGFMPYCWIISKWYRMFTARKNWLLQPTFFLAVYTAASNSIITSLRCFYIRIMSFGLLPDAARDHTASSQIYGPLLVVAMMALYQSQKPWGVKAAAFSALFALQWLLFETGLMYVVPGWFIPIALADLAG